VELLNIVKIIIFNYVTAVKDGVQMKNWWYGFYFLVLGVLSFFSGEFVTFVMLGFIFISLNNIHTTLMKIYEQNKKGGE
jgi:hypothetical protein